MDTLQETRWELQETMRFLGAVAAGIEDAVGQTANSITYLAGKELGRRFSKGARHTDQIDEALAEVRRILKDNHCLWEFEGFRPTSRPSLIETTAEGDSVMLVFRDCMIRQSLFTFGHPQKGSVCTMMFGFFAGALETIMGRQSTLDIVHAGENACYKKLTVKPVTAGVA
jgi:predicted hydrocarbon binding protein